MPENASSILHDPARGQRQSTEDGRGELETLWLGNFQEQLIQPVLKTAPTLDFLSYKLVNSLHIQVKLSTDLGHLQNWRRYN